MAPHDYPRSSNYSRELIYNITTENEDVGVLLEEETDESESDWDELFMDLEDSEESSSTSSYDTSDSEEEMFQYLENRGWQEGVASDSEEELFLYMEVRGCREGPTTTPLVPLSDRPPVRRRLFTPDSDSSSD